MRHPHGETVIRLRGVPVLDPYSQEVTGINWDTPSSLPIEFVAVDDQQSVEPLADGRVSVVSECTLYPPAGSDIKSSDRVVVRGVTYDVKGNPSSPRNPFTGDEPGMVVQTKNVGG